MATVSYLLTLRVDTDDETGDQGVTLIIGGTHRGGVSEGRWGFAGGLSTPVAHEIRDETMSCLGVMLSATAGHEQMILI